jgi:DNA polymerase-3 subunit delta'
VLSAFVETVNGWLAARLQAGPPEPQRLVRLAEAWDRFNAAARDAGMYNLERKPLVFSTFGLLAEAARG